MTMALLRCVELRVRIEQFNVFFSWLYQLNVFYYKNEMGTTMAHILE